MIVQKLEKNKYSTISEINNQILKWINKQVKNITDNYCNSLPFRDRNNTSELI